jgi:hypothetical protein
MYDLVQDALVHGVAVDHATLTLVDLGRRGTTCSVLLDGSIDERWAEAFALERRESRMLSRFELDRATRTVSFVREAGTDPADVIDALETLDAMVERVSDRARQTEP